MFTAKEQAQIAAHGLTVEQVERQIENFKKGFPFLKVVAAASPEDGITTLSPEEVAQAVKCYEEQAPKLKIQKFVPASGAATRMFKELFEFVNDDKRGAGIDQLLDNLDKFAFYPELEQFVSPDADDKAKIEAIVKSGLCYGAKPKGLVTFHAYPDGNRKAVEEHLAEGAMYAASNGVAKIHFTVSPEHIDGFRALLDQKLAHYESKFGNTPFLTEEGNLLFRPAGHGALIENLNEIDADIIFVKNIDNVTTDARKGDTITYKKALAGLLVALQKEAAEHLQNIDNGSADIQKVENFIEQKLCTKLPIERNTALLRSILDRPIRVCGMVRNEGEPGGGPFWVANPDGTQSLQIAESSQIAPEDMHLMKSATHFNPVDIVCGVRRADGTKFDLTQYTDPETGFISSKSSGGRELRAQELPGLWNGAMAKWNTVFVDVPISTFSPVKVVQDLLRPQHQ